MKNPIVIDSFKGRNSFLDATKIGADEFTDLINTHSKAGSLHADPVSSGNLTMPVPNIYFKEFTDQELREYNPAGQVLLTDTFTDTNGTALSAHTPDANTTGDVWHDVPNNFEIYNNTLRATSGTGTNPRSYINLNKTSYELNLKCYVWEQGLQENFTIYFRGNAVDPLTNYIAFNFGTYVSGTPFIKAYTDFITYNYYTDPSWYAGQWLDIKLIVTATSWQLYVNDTLITSGGAQYGSNSVLAFGYSHNAGISRATCLVDDLSITYESGESTILTPDRHYTYFVNGPFTQNQLMGVFFLMQADTSDGSYRMKGVIRKYHASGSEHCTDVDHWYEVETSDPTRVWRGFLVAPDANVSYLYFGIYTEPGSNVRIYGHPSCGPFLDWNIHDTEVPAPAVSSWSDEHPGADKPMMVIVTSTQAAVDDMKAVTLPHAPKKITGTVGANRAFSESSIITPNILSTVHNPSAPTYKNAIVSSIGAVNQPTNGWSGQDAYMIPKVILVKKDNVIAATAPDTQYCVPLAFHKNGLIDTDDPTTVVPHDTLDAVVFNGNLALTGCGVDSVLHAPNYVDLATNHTKALSYGPSAPEFVNVQGLALVYSKNYKYPFRTWYGVPGIIDSFAGNYIENIFLGDPIITVKSFQNSLLYFSPSGVKRYSGVPGSSSAAPQIWTEGMKSRFGAVETKLGVFCLLNRQLYLYNGSMVPIRDLTDIIRTKDDELRTNAFLMHLEKEEEILIQLDPSDSECIIYNYGQQKFRTINITSNFWRGNLPGLDRNLLYEDSGNLKTLYGGTTYAAITAEGGWISPFPELKNVKFLKYVIEASATSASTLINVEFDFENISPIQHTSIDLQHATHDYIEITKELGVTARRFKVKITSSATTEQPKIHRIKVYYEIAQRS